MTRARTPLLLAAVLALLVGVAVYAAYATRAPGFVEPTPLDAAPPTGLEAFYTQDLSWGDCGSAHCTWVTVPVDYAAPAGKTTRIRVAVHPATDDSRRSIFVNPGGPGGSAVEFARQVADGLGEDVREAADVVGVDPRGVGRSEPLSCLSDADFDAYSAADPDPDDAAEIRQQRDDVTAMGEACLAGSGELAAHVTTVEVARDMDVVRSLLGRKTLDWFGASYGTQLGAVYAELFPGQVGRMVLDGAVDPSLDEFDSSFAQAVGFQRALEAYATDCAASDSCPIGEDAEAGIGKIADLLTQLDAAPLKTDSDRVLTEGSAFYGIAVTLYDKTSWPALTQALTEAFDGDGSILLELADAYFGRKKDGSYASNMGQVVTAVNCLDSPGGSGQTGKDELDAQVARFVEASPVFGRALALGALGCADWPLKSSTPLPEIDGEGAPPIVVIGTTGDPATPYESAEALASQLSSGVLLTREGDGHTAYFSGNTCITRAVDRYLADGTVPKGGTRC